VARRLALSARTLHRRLAEEGTGFSALVDEVRRTRALALLEDGKLAASQAAFLLGFQDPAAFFRAFRRWTGTTPRAWREGRSERGGP
jgi:AraC-like DNA-binding protein